jgi:hypothetical protein
MLMEKVFLKFPSPVPSLEMALGNLDSLHQVTHRGGEVGHWTYEKVGEDEYRLQNSSPYPCCFAFGVLRGLTRKFGRSPHIVHGTECRMRGAERCEYQLSTS